MAQSSLDLFSCDANQVINLKLIQKASDIDELEPFHPVFTHQVFDNERIFGYSDLSIDIFCVAHTMYTYFKFSFSAKMENADDVYGLIAERLTGGFTSDIEEFLQHIDEPFEHPGIKFSQYCIEQDADSIYQVFKGNFSDSHTKAFHSRIQFFLLFFIDASSYVDDTDPIWSLLFVFKLPCQSMKSSPQKLKMSSTSVSFVGYTTLYSFLSYPDQQRLRISQILILPPFQKQGHGARLLDMIYSIARDKNYAEVNVEDPSPGFRFLRDLTDIRNCIKHQFFQFLPDQKQQAERRPASLERFDSTYASTVRNTLKITSQQVRRVYEVLKLATIDCNDAEEYRCYRLEIKQRLNRVFEEDLSVFNRDISERKAKLHEYYKKLEDIYYQLLYHSGVLNG